MCMKALTEHNRCSANINLLLFVTSASRCPMSIHQIELDFPCLQSSVPGKASLLVSFLSSFCQMPPPVTSSPSLFIEFATLHIGRMMDLSRVESLVLLSLSQSCSETHCVPFGKWEKTKTVSYLYMGFGSHVALLCLFYYLIFRNSSFSR